MKCENINYSSIPSISHVNVTVHEIYYSNYGKTIKCIITEIYTTFTFEFTATETFLKLSETYSVSTDVREDNKAWVMF